VAAKSATELDWYCQAERCSCRCIPRRNLPCLRRGLGRAGSRPAKRNRRIPLGNAAAIELWNVDGLAVANPVRSALPLHHIVGDHPGGLHRGLAELGVAGDFALNALAFGMQQIAQAFEFGNQVLDFRQ
jgi:hypothetical protein